MSLQLQIVLSIGILLFFIFIFLLLKKKKLNLKYSLIWLIATVGLFIITIFPQLADFFSRILGIASVVNAVFVVEGLFVLAIILSLTSIVSLQANKIRKLIQALALLEKRVRDLEKIYKKENKEKNI